MTTQLNLLKPHWSGSGVLSKSITSLGIWERRSPMNGYIGMLPEINGIRESCIYTGGEFSEHQTIAKALEIET
ncbi:hypothetical protein Xekj_01216 [Xenorhabdus sp. KJ12.1]|nr:hypothetical protein Xekj_01216 [Xenorhabdus sp. KJ12.1]